MKKRIALLLAGTLLLAGCAQKEAVYKESSPKKPLHIVFCSPVRDEDSWLRAKDGMEDLAATYADVTTEWVGPGSWNVDELIDLIDTSIMKKVDGIITMGMVPEKMEGIMEQAQEAGIPVVTVGSDIPGSKRLLYIGLDEEKYARLGADCLQENLKGKQTWNTAYQVAADDYDPPMNIVENFDRILAREVPKYHKLEVTKDYASKARGIFEWEQVLKSHPDLDVAVNISGNGASSCAKAVENLNWEDKGISILGIDDLPDTIEGIKNGSIIATCATNYYKKGYLAAKYLVEYLRNGHVPEKDFVDCGAVLVTQENITSYLEEMKDTSRWEELYEFQ